MNIVALARGAIERGAIQKFGELSPFLNLLQKSRLKTVVEIGTAKGGTLWALCQIADPKATIVSIDLPGGPFGGGYTKKTQEVFKTWRKPGQRIHFFRLDSHNAATKIALRRILGKRLIDVLLIDGDHTYAGAKQDWEMYSPLVRKDGLIAFHDILHHPAAPSCQVEVVWKEIKPKYWTTEIKDLSQPTWGGIGVVKFRRKPDKKHKELRGLLLDFNPIPKKQDGFTGVGNRTHPNVDIVADFEKFPLPFVDDSCHIIIANYMLQKIKPWLMIPFMDELWRIIKPGGQVAFAVPYPGSPAFYADPLNVNPCSELTFLYFDPNYPAYAQYEPKPWEIVRGAPQWAVGGNLEIVMRPIK
jgi:predicted O-methyltransferase YrrM